MSLAKPNIIFGFLKENFEARKQFIAFLFVGGINTLFGYGVYAFFIFIGFHYLYASLFSRLLGFVFNFFTMGKLVFKKMDIKLIKKFIIFNIFTYLLFIILIKLFSLWNVNFYLSGLIASGFMAILSYLINKYLVFL
ncbi:GtrA family protein [Rickettsiella endosymbiont of Miltochrista miniata]|uniref:GtrA family protein n=1 Tax=Rickettsiella endosymbiont of Miltochrista miniata TaxID=3066239 RepID=UPI00313DF4BD